jgi:AraC family transcriptional regulator of arabinose operon
MSEMASLGPLDQLHLRIKWVHERRRKSSFHLDLEFINSPYTIFWLVLTGTNELLTEGKKHRLKPGDFLVFPPQAPIRITGRGNRRTDTFHYLSIGCEAKTGVFNFIDLQTFPGITNLSDSASLSPFIALWRQMVEFSGRFSTRSFLPGAWQSVVPPVTSLYADYMKLYALLSQWFAMMLEMMLPYLPPVLDNIDPRIHRACTYIRNKLDAKLTLKDIARHVYLSEPHLRSLFYKTLGMAPTDFLQKERLARVKELLFSTDYRIKEIAEMVGYQEQGQLSRAFRLAEGISPQEYRYKGRLVRN